MHLSLILLAMAIACGIRLFGFSGLRGPSQPAAVAANVWSAHWHKALIAFSLPPALLLSTAIAVLGMGTQGQMLGLPVGWIGYSAALTFLGTSGVVLLWSVAQAWQSIHHIYAYPQSDFNGTSGRVLDVSTPFAAQIGFWQPELVLSRGLIRLLSPEQLEAVLTHEQAHQQYRDTFWFFWLGWLRQITAWLPQTDALWQELLLLRELRADQWAAQRVDSLLLAESLLLVIQAPVQEAPNYCVPFGETTSLNRLEVRIEALLAEPVPPVDRPLVLWFGLWFALLPFLTMLFHS
ncbi:MAG: M56 family metallopeptidase [Elainellaceae cyanobacterium]